MQNNDHHSMQVLQQGGCTSTDGRSVSCGCPNMNCMEIRSAVDLDKVVMINTIQNNKEKNVLSNEDLSFQEERRKVRRLDFEER